MPTDMSFQDILTYIILTIAFLYFRNTFDKKKKGEGSEKEKNADKIREKRKHDLREEQTLRQHKNEAHFGSDERSAFHYGPPPHHPLPAAVKQTRGSEKTKKLSAEEYYLENKIVQELQRSASSLPARSHQSPIALHFDHYNQDGRESGLPSRARTVLNRLSHLSDLVIYKEILGKPKGLDVHLDL